MIDTLLWPPIVELRDKEEHFVELPPEICQLKIIGFSKDIGSSLSLLPSIMHRLESLLVAIELKGCLSASFPEGRELAIDHVRDSSILSNMSSQSKHICLHVSFVRSL